MHTPEKVIRIRNRRDRPDGDRMRRDRAAMITRIAPMTLNAAYRFSDELMRNHLGEPSSPIPILRVAQSVSLVTIASFRRDVQ